MAWAATDIVPANINLSPLYSETKNAIAAAVTTIVVPRTSSGAIFNATALTGATAYLTNNPNNPTVAQLFATLDTSAASGSASGITLSFAADALATALAAIGTLTPSILVTATDGTTVLTVAQGRVAFQLVA